MSKININWTFYKQMDYKLIVQSSSYGMYVITATELRQREMSKFGPPVKSHSLNILY